MGLLAVAWGGFRPGPAARASPSSTSPEVGLALVDGLGGGDATSDARRLPGGQIGEEGFSQRLWNFSPLFLRRFEPELGGDFGLVKGLLPGLAEGGEVGELLKDDDAALVLLIEEYCQKRLKRMCEIVKEQDEGIAGQRGISKMAKFSDVETRLMERITNDRLRDSLALLRQAAEDIWAADSPHIVQDFTSHGIDHSERLAGFAAKLLERTDGRALSSQESYILLGGIYLHDIGMKCDVIKFSEIKKNAEKLGAKFEVEFSAETSSGYNIDEQKEIRKNHQYLSAAWIDYAKRTGETFLGPAAKQIPHDLVSDLIDVCKYHSKLPITECPITFKSDPNERKQLVAALLRFSDELDIDKNRVTIETVKNFRLDPNKAVYWWLHNFTNLSISDHNAITLIVQLNPVDKEKYGSIVHTAFITNFQTKNRTVIIILNQNGIPASMNAESRVEENSYTEQLPQEIARALESMEDRSDPLRELAEDVCTWLQAIQYEVTEPEKYDDRTIEFIATLDLGTLKQRVRVRCIEGEIGPQDVNVDGLDLKTPQGWFISDARVSPQARDKAAEHEAVDVFNLSEFMQQKVWRSYFDNLNSLAEKDRIPDLYVDLECYRQLRS